MQQYPAVGRRDVEFLTDFFGFHSGHSRRLNTCAITGFGKTLVFLTNNTALPSLTIAALYKSRWQVELFFKCTFELTPWSSVHAEEFD